MIKTALEYAQPHPQPKEYTHNSIQAVENALEAVKSITKPTLASKNRVLHKLSDISPIWKRLENPAISTGEIYQAAVKRFESHFPELYTETIE